MWPAFEVETRNKELQMSRQIPPVAILIGHRVADYDSWKKAFDAHTPAGVGGAPEIRPWEGGVTME